MSLMGILNGITIFSPLFIFLSMWKKTTVLLQSAWKSPLSNTVEMNLRRHRLMQHIPENGLVILRSNPTFYKAEHIFYPFRQQSDFLYFTGYNEPGDSAVIFKKLPEHQHSKDGSHRSYEMTMFVEPKDEVKEIWEGPMLSAEDVSKIFSCDATKPFENFQPFMEDAIKSSPVSFVCNLISDSDDTIGNAKSVKPSKILTESIRCIKSESELEIMRRANEITTESFVKTMKFTKPGLSEKSLEARLDYECKLRGSQGLAYVPVVASGNNANTIHYTKNNAVLKSGDLVLIDSGADLDNYVADVSRTYPINGIFSDPQKQLYAAVLNTQKACITKAIEKDISLDQIHLYSEQILFEELLKLGIKIDFDQVANIFPHHVGHYLGMDVHDTFSISRSIPLQPGMVITLEPGIYISKDNTSFPERYRGIGIRIEDNVIIGHGKVENITNVPKEICDIEDVMKSLS